MFTLDTIGTVLNISGLLKLNSPLPLLFHLASNNILTATLQNNLHESQQVNKLAWQPDISFDHN